MSLRTSKPIRQILSQNNLGWTNPVAEGSCERPDLIVDTLIISGRSLDVALRQTNRFDRFLLRIA